MGCSLARLRFAEEVIREDVDEALRLIEISKASLYNDGEHTNTSHAHLAFFTISNSSGTALLHAADQIVDLAGCR
jgi:DNA replicative helicase MCM subunit Mcm2 (Cdc46/Mcm family)